MWIKKDVFIALRVENASLIAEARGYTHRISQLERELDYWRGKFEAEQHRADRIADYDHAQRGLGPVSDLGVTETQIKETKKAANLAQRVAEHREMFADVLEDSENFPEEAGKATISPELMDVIKSQIGKLTPDA